MIDEIVTKRRVTLIKYHEAGHIFSYNYGRMRLSGPPTTEKIVDFTAGKPFGRAIVIYAEDAFGKVWKGVVNGWKGSISWS